MRLTLVLTLALLAAPAWHSGARSAALDNFWVANGPVNALAREGNTLYVGGGFTHIGPLTGGGVPIGLATGQRIPSFPMVDGGVSAVVSDGSGGWFIGGVFNFVAGVLRINLAHILADGSLSPWNP